MQGKITAQICLIGKVGVMGCTGDMSDWLGAMVWQVLHPALMSLISCDIPGQKTNISTLSNMTVIPWCARWREVPFVGREGGRGHLGQGLHARVTAGDVLYLLPGDGPDLG